MKGGYIVANLLICKTVLINFCTSLLLPLRLCSRYCLGCFCFVPLHPPCLGRKTRLDALGEYFDAVQTAKTGSGSNGLLMFRRVSNLAGTHKEYKESENHKNKKLTDTFVSDQVDALRELQEELLEEHLLKPP